MQNIVFFAQSITDLRTKFGVVLNMIMLLGFLLGVIGIVSGARQLRTGDYQHGKDTIIAALLIASSTLIMAILYNNFGLTSTILQAQ